jgi:hypothetical protein
MTKKNQGFRKDLDLQENINDVLTLNTLGGAGIAADLRIIQNNLRNTSSLTCSSVSNGFFSFPTNEFVFTNDDEVTVSTNINVGITTLYAGQYYYVCNSNTETQFKLSTNSSTVGLSTIIVTSISPNTFNFIRSDAVQQQNILKYIKPRIQDTDNFNYLSNLNINTALDTVLSYNQTAKFYINKKYRGNSDTVTNKDIKFEGTVIINDPANLNTGSAGLSDTKSPGIFIGDTRAFSSDNNPWTKVGTALSTLSSSVSVGELFFANGITITGINTEAATQVAVSSFTHKLPVVINGETYYILMLGKIVSYELLTYTTTGNLTVTGNGTNTVDIFKTSGGNGWDNQAYSTTAFTAPCTIEFNKQAASDDNGVSYAMIGWNADPATDASYSSIDYASFPYKSDIYSVYHNASEVHFSGTWNTSNKFYIVYGTDGFIRHYNGSKLLYSVNYGVGNTVYVDSSFYSVNSTFGGFSNIRVTKFTWNGVTYE